MGTAAVGVINIDLESLTNQGVQPLLPNTALATNIASGFTQPVNGTGVHIEMTVLANTTTGVVTINGTAPGGAVISEPTPTVPAPPANTQSPELAAFKYVTTQAFATVTSVTMPSGLANGGGLIRLGGIDFGKYLLPSEMKYDDKRAEYSANEHRNLPARHTNVMHLPIEETGDITQSLYPETSLWIAYMLFGNPVFIGPASNAATTLLKSAASASPIVLTTQPGPGSQIQFVVSGSTATGNITINGTNFLGAAISEVVAANGTNGNGTYTSVNAYWTITSITYTGLTTGSITVNAINASNNLLVGTAVAANMTLATPPLLPGQNLIFSVSGTAIAGTITVVGTDPRGRPVSDVITVPANGAGLYYTQNVYQTVNNGVSNQFSTTGLTAGTIAVYGTFGWIYKWNDITNAAAFYTAALEFFSGTDSRIYPFTYLEEASVDFTTMKEVMTSLKWRAQDGIPVGDRTTSPLAANRLAALPQPSDMPIAGWQSLCWIDPLGTTPKTNQYTNLTELKANFKVPKEPIYPALNTQRYGQVYMKKEGRDFDIEAKVDYRDLVMYEAFRQNLKKVFTFGNYGPSIGFVSGAIVQKAWEWTLPVKFHGDGNKPESTPAKANVDATYKLLGEYDPTLGYTVQLTVTNQMPPVYPN